MIFLHLPGVFDLQTPVVLRPTLHYTFPAPATNERNAGAFNKTCT